MSILASDIIKGVIRRLGRPAQGDMPYQDLLSITLDVVRERRLDLKLSTKNRTLEIGSWSTPNAKEMPSAGFANGLDNFLPVKVEWRMAGSDDVIPAKAEVVNYANLADLYSTSRGETYVSFYEGFSMIAFPESVDTLQSREYRIVLENLEDVDLNALTDRADFPDLFITLLMDDISLRAIDYVDSPTVEWAEKRERLRPSLMANLAKNEQRFDVWKRTQYGNRKVQKQGFRPR
jgi:hypothetical protein